MHFAIKCLVQLFNIIAKHSCLVRNMVTFGLYFFLCGTRKVCTQLCYVLFILL